jgi:FkbM family methyltransferase
MSLKQLFMGLLPHRQREQLRFRILARQVVAGEPIREKEIELIRRLVGAGDRTADIGANVGLFTRELAALVTPTGHVYSFEPVMNNHKILLAVVERAHLDNVTIFNVALGAQAGERTIVVPDADGFVGYYQAHFDSDGKEAGRREVIATTTLDTLFAKKSLPPLDFVKCDVEGAELEVLRGGVQLIRASKPGFMIEVSKGTSAECFAFFHDLEYSSYVYDGELRSTKGYLDGQFSNYFFLHRDSKAMARAGAAG